MTTVANTPREQLLAAPGLRQVLASHALPLIVFGTIVLRLLMFTGRGDYVAFDEGWYLLLGRSLVSGAGYTLSGLQHTTLSPLFPILAGAASTIAGDAVWGGRIVAALAAGLLIWPCWHIFRHLGGERTALLGCLFTAAMPSLAPFVVPFWIGWDLWVGAEPLLYLCLYGGIALTLRARDLNRSRDWLLAGTAFGLAYLARPEAVIPFGLTGMIVGVDALRRRSGVLLSHCVTFGLAFTLTAAPYWFYLHDVLDRWALTGRVVEMAPAVSASGTGGNVVRGGAARTIEGMLWAGNSAPYIQSLYGLNSSGDALASTYWGVPRSDGAPVAGAVSIYPEAEMRHPETGPAETLAAGRVPDSRLMLYARSLAGIVPWYVWLLAVAGVFGRRRAWQAEIIVAVPLLLTSIAIAGLVAIDLRTQIFIAPLVAYYAARGVGRTARFAGSMAQGRIGIGFMSSAIALSVIALLAGTQARWLYLSVTLGSPHHVVGAANRVAGEAMRAVVPEHQPVMSWHPALALYADRDWRVLPAAPLPNMVRYANAIGSEYVVLSAYYPSPIAFDNLPRRYLLLRIPPAVSSAEQLQVRLGAPGPVLIPGEVRALRKASVP